MCLMMDTEVGGIYPSIILKGILDVFINLVFIE